MFPSHDRDGLRYERKKLYGLSDMEVIYLDDLEDLSAVINLELKEENKNEDGSYTIWVDERGQVVDSPDKAIKEITNPGFSDDAWEIMLSDAYEMHRECEYIAQDEDGRVWQYSGKPRRGVMAWVSNFIFDTSIEANPPRRVERAIISREDLERARNANK